MINYSRAGRTALLTAHIAASAGVIGAAGVLLALGLAGARGADPRTIYPAAYLVETRVIAPLAVLALGTGVALVFLGRYRMPPAPWIRIKFVITAALTIVVFTVLVPALAALAEAAETAAPLTEAQRLRVVIFPSVALILLLLNVVLGVAKPRLGRRARPDHARPLVRTTA